MKERLKVLAAGWQKNKLCGSLELLWLATVASSFFGSYLLPITLPAIGTIYLFRILLPITALFYILWAVRVKEHIWRDASAVERWCYILAAIMLAYGAVSLFWAMDFQYSFRKFFNLCFDLCFFLLMLRLCRDRRILRRTLRTAAVVTLILAVLGIYEIFFGGVFNDKYNVGTYFSLFNSYYQFPVVTSSTCNEYSGTLLFIFASVILLWAENPEPPTRRRLWIIVLALPVIFFLIKASSARLCLASFFFLLIGVSVWCLCQGRKLFWVPGMILVMLLCVEFACQYRYIVPPIRQYLAEMEQHQSTDSSETQKPSLPQLGDPRTESLEKQFFTENEETGERELRMDRSAGERALLLIHAFNCFRESKGLGMGLGNTEILARERKVTGEANIWALHCFIARIIADYGIFVLIPLCIIALLLFKRVWELLAAAIQERNRTAMGLPILFLCVLVVFIFSSTASADAQDLLPMWIYLATVAIFAAQPDACLTIADNKMETQNVSPKDD